MTAPHVARWQLVAADPAQAAAFYRSVFGWKVSTANALGYREIEAQPGGIGGGIWPAPPDTPAFVQMFVAVDDVAATVERAVAAGASVIVPVSVLPDGDEMAVLRDPSGVPMGLMKSSPVSRR